MAWRIALATDTVVRSDPEWASQLPLEVCTVTIDAYAKEDAAAEEAG